MKRIILYLLRGFIRKEKGRLEVYKLLQEACEESYTEQTGYGNFQNAQIEFLLANRIFVSDILEEDKLGTEMLRRINVSAFEEAEKQLRQQTNGRIQCN